MNTIFQSQNENFKVVAWRHNIKNNKLKGGLLTHHFEAADE